MTADPLTAALDQLAACREYLSDLDAREAGHYTALSGQLTHLSGMVTTISRTLADDTAALARLDALDRQVTDLARRFTGPGGEDGDDEESYRPRPAPQWWKLTPAERRAPVAELRDWVEHVYGHLAAALGPCWPEHDLCLYGLDILTQLWSALYLQPDRSITLLSAQAEYQARILPAITAQLAAETTRCAHNPVTGYPRSAL
jgi:hypothetical protein